jgi:GNAT superfamily N-acetyltransferase
MDSRRAPFGVPGVGANKALGRVLTGDDGVWWVTCFAVDSRYRRSGPGLALLQAAVELARQHEATAVDGHPVDVAGLRAARVAASALRTGTKAMFAAAGFVEIAHTYPARPVMRLDLGKAASGSPSGAKRARGQGRAS